MLETLRIRNFALIENLEISFSKGFNVITGETGAGKSIILGALGLLLGEKADSSVIRTGSQECIVSAEFSIPDNHPVISILQQIGVELDEQVVLIRRVIRASGARGSISVQGQNVSRTELAQICDSLVDLHSQHEHQSLVGSEQQRRILDSYSANEKFLSDCEKEYSVLKGLEAQRQELQNKIDTALREKDYLQFALSQIKKVNPKAGEEDSIREEISVLSQFESLTENLQLTIANLSSAKDQLFDASGALTKASLSDSKLNEELGRVESIRIEANDLYESLRDRLGGLTFSQDKLDSLQLRLIEIQKLKKYGKSIEDINTYADSIESILKSTENSEIELSKLDKKIRQQSVVLQEAADRLSLRRKDSAGVLGKAIVEKLVHLGMPSAAFEIKLDKVEVSSKGQDEVHFMISPNKGEVSKPISQIASGGELSRIMLAIKTVLSDVDEIQTQVFDEVDAGIGGSVAQAVAIQLKGIAENRQVIAITHLASIASKADRQQVVSKHEISGRTFSTIKEVSGEERVKEIARMLSGEDSDVSLEHARSLLSVQLPGEV